MGPWHRARGRTPPSVLRLALRLGPTPLRCCSSAHSPAEGMYTHATYWKGKFAAGMMPQLKQYGNEDLIQTIRCVHVGVSG